MNKKLEIAKQIQEAYEFNGYEIPKPDILKHIVEAFELIIKRNLIVPYDKFFVELRIGTYGVMYKMSSDIVSKFRKFADEYVLTRAEEDSIDILSVPDEYLTPRLKSKKKDLIIAQSNINDEIGEQFVKELK
jgi:hypothetical protein